MFLQSQIEELGLGVGWGVCSPTCPLDTLQQRFKQSYFQQLGL